MKKNLIGQKFGRLTVLQPTEKRKRGLVVWKCQCECGNIIQVPTTDLTCNRKKSCGCWEKESQQTFGQRTKELNKKDRTNQRYGRLIALYPIDKKIGTNIIWHCKCDCGKEIDVNGSLLGKYVFSCGCLRKDLAKERGLRMMNSIKEYLENKFDDTVKVLVMPVLTEEKQGIEVLNPVFADKNLLDKLNENYEKILKTLEEKSLKNE